MVKRGGKRIGSLRAFCHNRRAMKEVAPQWKTYRAQMLYYLRLLPLGAVIAAIPLLFNLAEWRRAGTLATGVGISLVYGLAIPLTIWFCYGVFYGARLWLGARAGVPLRYPWVTNVLINFTGLWLGLWLALHLIEDLFRQPASSDKLRFSLLFGCLAMIFFALHFAYRRAKEEALSLRAAVAEAKYHALETQMRPHFLFNALNSLAELIEAGQSNAAVTTYKLAELYRQILANSQTKTAPLASELEVVRAYLEIEQLRFGDRLTYQIQVEEGLSEVYLPSLLLQTLVENAIKHGIAPALAGGSLTIAVTRAEHGGYRAQVRNTGQALPETARAGQGTGLPNALARLALLYGEQHQFRLARDPDGQTVACFYFSGAHLD
jgi:hypothetical protein